MNETSFWRPGGDYLDYLAATATPGGTMSRYGMEATLGNLSPSFATRLLNAVTQAQAEGINASIHSAYRAPGWGVGGYRDKYNSLHAHGLAVDVAGIGRPGSVTAERWYEIASANGIFNPYGPDHPKEWNHYQAVPQKGREFIADNPDLRATIDAGGPIDREQMWAAAEAAATNHPIPPADIPNPPQTPFGPSPTGSIDIGPRPAFPEGFPQPQPRPNFAPQMPFAPASMVPDTAVVPQDISPVDIPLPRPRPEMGAGVPLPRPRPERGPGIPLPPMRPQMAGPAMPFDMGRFAPPDSMSPPVDTLRSMPFTSGMGVPPPMPIPALGESTDPFVAASQLGMPMRSGDPFVQAAMAGVAPSRPLAITPSQFAERFAAGAMEAPPFEGTTGENFTDERGRFAVLPNEPDEPAASRIPPADGGYIHAPLRFPPDARLSTNIEDRRQPADVRTWIVPGGEPGMTLPAVPPDSPGGIVTPGGMVVELPHGQTYVPPSWLGSDDAINGLISGSPAMPFSAVGEVEASWPRSVENPGTAFVADSQSGMYNPEMPSRAPGARWTPSMTPPVRAATGDQMQAATDDLRAQLSPAGVAPIEPVSLEAPIPGTVPGTFYDVSAPGGMGKAPVASPAVPPVGAPPPMPVMPGPMPTPQPIAPRPPPVSAAPPRPISQPQFNQRFNPPSPMSPVSQFIQSLFRGGSGMPFGLGVGGGMGVIPGVGSTPSPFSLAGGRISPTSGFPATPSQTAYDLSNPFNTTYQPNR